MSEKKWYRGTSAKSRGIEKATVNGEGLTPGPFLTEEKIEALISTDVLWSPDPDRIVAYWPLEDAEGT